MNTLSQFKSLISALGMLPKEGKSLDGIFQRYQELEKEDDGALVALWEDLRPEPVALEWSEVDYEPENALKKRAVLLGCQVVESFAGTYPKHVDFEMDEGFQHLVMHGKCGLMALLFALQEADSGLKVPQIAAMIERFMEHIESLVENLIFNEDASAFAQALSINEKDDSVSFEAWVKGRLQPFALMRSVYLEAPASELSPLEWWVAHERYIPALPQC